MKTFFLTLCLWATFICQGQTTKPALDVIIKTNGEHMDGQVKEITDDAIKFVYVGESVMYTLKKSEVLKITFASGRSEYFTRPPETPAQPQRPVVPTVSEADARNKVAIMPIRFIVDKRSGDEEMMFRAQEEAYTILQKQTATLTFQDVHTTNAILLKAGIDPSNLRAYTPADLAAMLGVEYVVTGSVNILSGRETATTTRTGSVNVNEQAGKTNNNTRITNNGTTTTTTTQEFRSTVTLNIFNRSGASIFTQNRTAFLNLPDSYRDALQYMLKRCPLYKR